jgi:ketosteroid isomerase-like protein
VKRAALALCLLVLAAGARAGDDPDKIAEAVGAKFTAACDAGNIDAVVALYQTDARVVYPGENQSAGDPKELRRVVSETCVKGGPKFELASHHAIWLDKAHTVVASLNEWKVTGPDGKPGPPLRATEVMVKTKNGWRYAVDHASFGVPPAPPAR